MVFESIVVDMMNKYLGEFVEDLDKSQLSIGIWSTKQGDVVLKKLNLKETALKHLNIPVKIKAGHLGKLTLKVPWKNLYTEPVVVHIQDIYALTVPDTAVKYDLEMDRQAQFAEKLARLAQIELQKKLEAEKVKPWDPTQDTFVEKLSIQIIKNLQIKVTSLHLRHEDAFNNPKRPISIGITLKELLFQTTDASWKETVIKEAVTQIYKLVRLDSLSVYWNSKSDLMQENSKKKILNALADNIPKLGSKSNHQFLFQPISAVAHLRLNTKPELMNLALPKLQLTLVFDEITMNLSKDQFDDILEMLESMERMSLRSKYMATRPGVPYSGNAKLWWRHAYAVVLQYTVQRRRNMWKWHIIKKHRENLKLYRELYTQKLGGRKLSRKELEKVATIEEELDILNICICRNQAELEVARMDKKREKSKMTKWFTGWLGGKESESNSVRGSQTFIAGDFNKFSEEFTDDEKSKLYKAIGYDENAKDATYPVEFVSVRLVVKLNKLCAVLMGDKRTKENPLLKMMLTEICASFGQRPAANSIRLDMKVDQLIAIGTARSDYMPKLINSVGVSKEANISLLTMAFETNPLDNLCETRVRINSRPLEIIYDAVTVNGLATFFRPPESVKLKQLSNAAMAKYDEIISQTTAGVIYMMSERKYADIEVHLMPSYIIVPETGELKKDVKMLLLNLGSLNVTSEKNKEMSAGTQMSQKELASYAYDKFNVSLENVQLLFVQPGDTWQNESQSVNSPLYILQPMSMQVLMEKCILSSDIKYPEFQMSGVLPLVAVTVSDNKLLAILNLIQSIPLPAPPPEPKFDFEEEIFDESSRMTALHLTRISRARGDSKLTSEFRNLTKLSVKFIIQEVSLEIRETRNKIETPFLQFIIVKIGANLKVRTFDLSLEVILGGIFLKHLQYKISQNIRHQLEKCQVMTEENVNIINSPFVDEDEPLLSIRFIKANRRGPEFKTTYNNTTQSITVEFSTLDIVLHQGVLLSLLDFFKKFEMSSAKQFNPPPDLHRRGTSTLSLISQRSFAFTDKSKQRADIQLLKVKALVDNIQLGLCNAKCVIMHSRVEGIEFGIGMQHQTIGVTTLMRKIEVTDPDPMTYHPQIFSVQGTDMLRLELTHFKNPTRDINNVDAVLSLQMGRAQIVFVNKFCMSIVHFFDNFAVAKAKLDEARRLVQEASLDMAKNLQENVPHVKFDIMIKAPLIVVPQNSRSQSVLNVHLGDVTVHNRFEHGIIRGKKDTWVVENMIVKLTNLCISRGIVQHGSILAAVEITLLEPLSFIVDIRRNLSSAYYHDIPSIEVKGVLEKIDIKLNQEDVRLIMQIATENVDERYADGPTSAKAKLVIVRDKRVLNKQRSPAGSCLSKVSIQAPSEIYCFLKLDFKLLAINIELYRGLVNLLDTEAAKLPERLLTYLALNTVRVNHSMQSDNSVLTSLYLHDINMDDCRQEKVGGITKLIRRTAFKSLTRAALKLRAKEAKENMVIHMNFEENSDKDKTINGHVCSLHLCICFEFLMKVMEFFTKSVPVKDPDEVNRTTEMKAILEHKDAVKDMKFIPPMVGSIDISVKLEKPEIYVIEDQMNPHTDSLIVNLELAFHMHMSQYTLSMNGGISRLSLISCVFEKDDAKKSYFRYFKWSQDKTRKISSTEKELLEICYNYYEHKWEMLPILNYVLTPLDITIVGSGPQNRDHHVDVVMTDFILSVTPSTVRLLTAIAAGMSLTPEPDMTLKKQKDYSHIWDKKNLSDCNYWYTQSVVETESAPLTDKKTSTFDLTASSSMTDAQTITILYVKEKFLQRKVRYYGNQIKELLPRYLNLLVYAPVIVLKLEGRFGYKTCPLLIVESSVSSQIHNWTSDIYMRCTLGIEIAYNNENIGVWEPILEPVVNPRKSTSRKWDIVLEMVKNPESDDACDEKLLPPPKTTVNIVATQPLNLVLSKTCLKVLYQLVEAFQDAYQLRECEGTIGQHVYPYLFRNRLGANIKLIPDNSFEVVAEHMSMDLNEFQSGADLSMNIAIKKVLFKDESLIRSTQPVEKIINICLEGSTTSYNVHIKQSKKRVFTFGNDKVVVTVEVLLGQKVISFKSLVQIKNHLNVPMLIKYKEGGDIVIAGEVYPGNMFSLPLKAVGSPNGELFFQPKTEDSRFSTCKDGVLWKTLTDDTQVTQISCETIEEGHPPYHFNILPEFEKVLEGNTRELTSEMVYLHLHPTVILHNLLPFSVQISLEGTSEMHTLEAGHQIPLSHASVNESKLQVQITDYRSHSWIGHTDISDTAPQLSTLTFKTIDSGDIFYMFLGLHCKLNEGSLDISVYSPYWIVNLTSQDIALKEVDKETVFYHLKDDKGVMLFYFDHTQEINDETGKKTAHEKATRCASCLNCASKPFQSHKRVCLQIASAHWSDKFSLDAVGSHGHIACISNTKGHTLQVGVSITLASSALTKIVTFSPFYLLLNASNVQLSVREQNTFDWIHLNPGECRGFYPASADKELRVIAKVHDSLNETLPFYANKNHTTLLRLCDKFGGINAECQVTDSMTITILKTYQPGMATGLLVNYLSNFSVTIKQVGVSSDIHVLEPNTSELYTWTEPTAKREVMWTCGNKKDVRSTLDRDKIQGFVMQNGVKFYFVSFLDGLQRVIMFTEDATSATLALEAGELEQADQEINVRIYEVGFSLVNNEKPVEVVYMGITSSGVIWEQKKTNFKMLKAKDAENMEKAYQKYKLDNVKSTTSLVKIDNVEVDFKNMQVLKPYMASIRRSYEDGIWMQIRKSPYSIQFHAKINRLQIDNQMKDSIFPTILSPIPLPRSVTLSNVPVPFIEMCLITRIHRHSSLQQIKYFKVLIQEMNIKIDQSFINGMLTIFASDAGTVREKELTQFKEDVALTMRDLKEEAGVSVLSMRVSFFDYFHISPIKINFSFSLQGAKMGDAAYSGAMGIFLQSVGVVLTDVHDVVFKLGYFEKNYSFCDNSKLMKEFIIHYTGQAIKQMYVLVLGLDVLGNPFGLLRGLTEGIEDLFYEPYQGAIQGPDEFLEGLTLGVRSLFGHTIGGTAGAVSKITGSLGKGLAALAFDKNYQQRRTEQSRKIPINSREAFALGGKELVMGVYSGVTGVVTLPLTGARQKGFKGFVKGIGMGMVGVFIKPVSGVMGFASRSLEGIYRITNIREDIKHLRPAHTFSRDGVMNPYNYEEAEGYSLLVEIDKSKYVDTDDYLAHVKLKEDNKTIKIVFIVTDKRIMLAKRSNIFGVWNTEWMFTYDELAAAPETTDKGIEFNVRDKDMKTIFLSDTATFRKELAIPDPEVAQIIAFKIMEAMQTGEAVAQEGAVAKDSLPV